MQFSHQKNADSCTFAVDFAEEQQLVHVGIKAEGRQPDLFKLFRGNPAVLEKGRFNHFLPPLRVLPHKHESLQHQKRSMIVKVR
jgi:hypothetical protein